jgi:hypothetical protein
VWVEAVEGSVLARGWKTGEGDRIRRKRGIRIVAAERRRTPDTSTGRIPLCRTHCAARRSSSNEDAHSTSLSHDGRKHHKPPILERNIERERLTSNAP